MAQYLSWDSSDAIIANLNHLLRRLPAKQRVGFWTRLRKFHGNAAYVRILRGRSGEHRFRESDLALLADQLRVSSQRLLVPVGTRLRTKLMVIYPSEAAQLLPLSASTLQAIEDGAALMSRCKWIVGWERIQRRLDEELSSKQPTSQVGRIKQALKRALTVRDELGLGLGPLPSLRWIAEMMGILITEVDYAEHPSHLNVFSARCRGAPLIVLFRPAFQKLPWSDRRFQLCEVLWRLLLDDASQSGLSAKLATRAFFIPDKLGIPLQAAQEHSIVRRKVAHFYGVPAQVVANRLTDWRGPGALPIEDEGGSTLHRETIPFAEMDEYLFPLAVDPRFSARMLKPLCSWAEKEKNPPEAKGYLDPNKQNPLDELSASAPGDLDFVE